jgi:hypothetical protein
MKIASTTCVALLFCAFATVGHATEAADITGGIVLKTPFGGEAETYYREHRLRAYDKIRASTSQGANCVTPAMVCWINQQATRGDACSCETPQRGVVGGVVGG